MEIYSARKRKETSGQQLLRHDEIPSPLRVQILNVMEDARRELHRTTRQMDHWGRAHSVDLFSSIRQVLCAELGVRSLFEIAGSPPPPVIADDGMTEFERFMDTCPVIHFLDGIEVLIHVLHEGVSEGFVEKPLIKYVETRINERFLQHGIGFQASQGKIIEVSNQLVHREVVEPALELVALPGFRGANAEFLSAHVHFRHGRFGECLNECLKAFESTMKIICTKRNWQFQTTDTAKNLIRICLDNGLLPTYTDQQLTQLRVLLESGIPTVRNKMSGHGQGATITPVPKHLAEFGLHVTAAAILLLIESHQNLA